MTTGDRLSRPSYERLHHIRVRGRWEGPEDECAADLVVRGLTTWRQGFLMMPPEGREIHQRWARLPDGSEEQAAVRESFERFLPLNQELLRICTDWQVLRGGVPNDHQDATYDWGVIDRLLRFDERVGPLVDRLGKAVPRFAVHRPRLRAAARQVEEGDHEWFASVRRDSYHTVWMQLHEEFLVALGIERDGNGLT